MLTAELLRFPLFSDSKQMVSVPSRNLHLLFKAEAFLMRRFLKARDVFDIKLLWDSGARLGVNLKSHLVDGVAGEKLENPEYIVTRINQLTRQTCEPELKAYLPEDLYQELALADFEPLREVLRNVFSEWLKERPHGLG